MSENIEDVSLALHASGLGLALKQGRESKNYTVERVADELHLRPSIVNAIEEESYELLPGEIFLKGYIRSYSRLVGLNEDEMVGLLEQQLTYEANLDATEKQAKGKAIRKKRSKHALLLLLISSLLGAGFYFWSEKLGNGMSDIFPLENQPEQTTPDSSEATNMGASAIEGDVPTIENDAPVVESIDSAGIEDKMIQGDTQANDVAVEPSSEGGAETSNEAATSSREPTALEYESQIELAPDSVEVLSQPAASVSENDSDSDQASSVDDGASESSSELSTNQETGLLGVTETEERRDTTPSDGSNVEEPVVESEAETSEAVVPVVELEQGTIKVIFSGECWFTLKNGEGRTVFAALKQAGDEINYSGPLPFSVVVGAVSEVSMFFDDKAVDFSTVRIRNNRASLELTH